MAYAYKPSIERWKSAQSFLASQTGQTVNSRPVRDIDSRQRCTVHEEEHPELFSAPIPVRARTHICGAQDVVNLEGLRGNVETVVGSKVLQEDFDRCCLLSSGI